MMASPMTDDQLNHQVGQIARSICDDLIEDILALSFGIAAHAACSMDLTDDQAHHLLDTLLAQRVNYDG